MDWGLKMTDDYSALTKEASRLAEQLFDNDVKKCASFSNRLLDICTRAQGKDFLIIHNPGGWGTTPLEHLLQWERSIVEGVSATIEGLGYSWLQMQYFRTDNGWRDCQFRWPVCSHRRQTEWPASVSHQPHAAATTWCQNAFQTL